MFSTNKYTLFAMGLAAEDLKPNIYPALTLFQARFKNPAGVAVRDERLFVCDQGNETIRVVNMLSTFCHASRIDLEGDEASQNEEEDCAARRIL